MARTALAHQSDDQAAEQLAFVDAALALAGHEVNDPALRTIMERAARDEVSGEDAVAEVRRHVQG